MSNNCVFFTSLVRAIGRALIVHKTQFWHSAQPTGLFMHKIDLFFLLLIERNIVSFSHHPDYNYPESYFDIGVAKLNESVPSNAFGTIRPICLPTIPSENIGEYFSIYRKSSNIRRPHKIVAHDFSQFLILYRDMDAWPISNLLPFLRPSD